MWRSGGASMRDLIDTGWQQSSRLALVTLLVANLIPLFAVLSGSWTLFSVMYLYWAENGVVGFFNVLKLAFAQGSIAQKIFRIPFFVFHYGIFWFVHGVFVFVLFGGGINDFDLPNLLQTPQPLWGALGLMVLSHGASFTNNFIGRGEYKRVTVEQQMMQPYGRVVILHVVVLFGGMVVLMLGQPLVALVLLVLLKTGFDLSAHLRQHLWLQQPAQPAQKEPALWN
jgi:hypothetical protein